MTHKVALINMKGGVGKSTIAANLAWHMALGPWRMNVLVIDLDPQFNCSQYLIGHNKIEALFSEGQPTVWDIFEQFTVVPGQRSDTFDVWNTVHTIFDGPTGLGSVDLIPSSLELSHTLRNPTGKEQLLKRAVEGLEGNYDLVIIDCAPTESILTTAAYLVADYLLIPVRPEFLSAIGLPLLEQSLNQFEQVYREELPSILGIVFNAMSNYAPEETTSRMEVLQIAVANGWPTFNEEIRYSKSFPSSARRGTPLLWTPYARSIVKRNFHRFASEFARRIGT